MGMANEPPRYLIWIGDNAWVDPFEVIAVDAYLEEGDPSWARCRVLLRSGHIRFGLRSPERVVAAVRHPERESEVAEAREIHPDPETLSSERHRGQVHDVSAPEPLRPRSTEG
jgi:hypothetical protein